jgi:N-acyl homoserine lactone hydrolase
VTSVRRLYVLLCGFEIMRKTISTKNRGRRFVLSEPVSAYLLDTTNGWVLMDAGFDRAAIRGPQELQAYFDRTDCYPPVVGDDHLIETQLTEIGVAPAQIRTVVLSHFHSDHTGFLKHLPGARVFTQKAAYDDAHGPGLNGAYAPSDYQGRDLDWRLLDGDYEFAPGISLLSTPGHIAGHMSAVIELPNNGTIVLPFDAGDLAENFDDEIAPGGLEDEGAALASIRRLKAITAERNGRMILFHDPVAIQSTRLAPDFYD